MNYGAMFNVNKKKHPFCLHEPYQAEDCMKIEGFQESKDIKKQGWHLEFSNRGAESSNEGAKIWFSGYYKCQNLQKHCFSPSDIGLACSDRGL